MRASVRPSSQSVRLLLALCLSLLFPASAWAEGRLAGYVTGPNNLPVISAQILVRGLEGQAPRAVLSDSQGFFALNGLPIDQTYSVRVEADGYSSLEQGGITVADGATTHLSLRLVPSRAGVGVITDLAAAPAGTAVLESKELVLPLLETLPTWDLEASLRRIPGYARTGQGPSDGSLRGLAAFDGAASGENRYLVDGFDITLPMTGQPAFVLPVEFLERVAVDGGGYGAELGEALGARADQQTRFGGNAFQGDFFARVVPYAGPASERVEPNTGGVRVAREDQQLLEGQTGFALGGFLVRDRIWIFLGAAPAVTLGRTSRHIGVGSTLSTEASDNLGWRIPALARLTLNPTVGQSLQLSGYGEWKELRGAIRPWTDETTGVNGDPATWQGRSVTRNGVVQARYSARLPRLKSQLDARAGFGWFESGIVPLDSDLNLNGTLDGEEQQVTHTAGAQVADTLCGEGPCSPRGYRSGGWGDVQQARGIRGEGRVLVTHYVRQVVGDHQIRWGAQLKAERLTHSRRLTGGALGLSSQLGSEPELQQTLVAGPYTSLGESGLETEFSSQWLGGFLSDQWSPVRPLTIELGARLDQQLIQQDSDELTRTALAASPRLSVLWRYRGEDGGRLEASVGRYATSVPLWLVDAALSTPAVTCASGAGESMACEGTALASQATPASAWKLPASLSLPQQTEAIVGWHERLPAGIGVGLHGIYRQLNSSVAAVGQTLEGLTLTNPGQLPGEIDGTTRIQCFSSTAAYGDGQAVCVRAAVRTYQATQLTLQRTPPDGRGFWLEAGYSLSRLEGDEVGLEAQGLGMEPSSALQVWHPENLPDSNGVGLRYGPLPADRTHRVQLETALDLPLGLRVGVWLEARSGTPLSALAYASDGAGRLLVAPAGTAGRLPWVLEQAVSVGAVRRLREGRAFNLQVQVVNPLQLDAPIRVDERVSLGTLRPVSSTALVSCLGQEGLQRWGCVANPEAGTALERQEPLSVRVNMRYRF